jgi:DNA-directed RNA polymerase beta' subunit
MDIEIILNDDMAYSIGTFLRYNKVIDFLGDINLSKKILNKYCYVNNELAIPSFIYDGTKEFIYILVTTYLETDSLKNINTEIQNYRLLQNTLELLNIFGIYVSIDNINDKYIIKNKSIENTIIPNCGEYNNNILVKDVLQNNQSLASDIVYDEIVNIEIIKDNNQKVYDFTIPLTETFKTTSGIMVHNTLNTFHSAGIYTKSNIATGIPRLTDLLSVSSTSKTRKSSMTIYLNDENKTDGSFARMVSNKIEYTLLNSFVNKTEIYYDPDPINNTTVLEDKELIETYINSTLDKSRIPRTGFLKWIIRFVLDKTKMIFNQIRMSYILKLWQVVHIL